MKLQTKLTLDKYVAKTVLMFFAIGSMIKRKLTGKRENRNQEIGRIVVCKFLGMGSIIQSTPLLLSLRKNYPEAEIIFITSYKNYELIRLFPFIDNILIINDRNIFGLVHSFVRTSWNLLTSKVDLFVDLEVHSFFSSVVTALSFSKMKIGYFTKKEVLKGFIYSEMIYYNSKVSLVQIYLQAARLIGCENLIMTLYDFNAVKSENFQNVFKKLEPGETLFENDYVVINPNASDLRIERRWPLTNYAELIEKLICENLTKKVIIIGAKNEMEYVRKLINSMDQKYSKNVVNSAGKLSFEELVVLINHCSLMITNDSGPMHIAFALKKNTIALFGPCSPLQYMNQSNVKFIYANVFCSPCVHHFTISPCNGDNQCMKLIESTKVFEIVESFYPDKSPSESTTGFPQIIYSGTDKSSVLGILKSNH